MPKLKTHSGAKKRIRRSGSGKLLHGHPYKNHFLSKKTSARKRGYSGLDEVTPAAEKRLKRMGV